MPTRIDTRPVGARKWIAPVTTLQVQSCSISDSVASGEVPPRPKRKRSKGQSPTARTLAVCRKRGWEAQAVERFNSYTKQRIDLFGVIDIVAITPAGILGIQACVGGDHAKRMKKRSTSLGFTSGSSTRSSLCGRGLSRAREGSESCGRCARKR